MGKRPQVGERIINDHGTVLTVIESPGNEGDYRSMEVPEYRLDEFLASGYRYLRKDDAVPLQMNRVVEEAHVLAGEYGASVNEVMGDYRLRYQAERRARES